MDDEFERRYELLATLGAGTMGEVVKARQLSLDRTVAIKFFSPGLVESDDDRRRFEHEAKTLARLQHPNVVQVVDFGRTAKLPYIVLEHVDGETLADWIARQGSVKPVVALDLMRGICAGLEQAHAAKIVHRDLKSANVLLGRDGVPKIADFGLAKETEGRADQTAAGIILGTPAYMSPEQCRNERLDGRSDLYSAGVILFELLTGRVPFDAPSRMDVLVQQLQKPAPHLAAFVPNAPRELDDLVQGALAKSPAQRYPTARAFAIALERTRELLARKDALELSLIGARGPRPGADATLVLARADVGPAGAAAQRPPQVPVLRSPPTATPGRAPLLFAALGGAAVTVAVAVSFALLRSPPPPPSPVAGVDVDRSAGRARIEEARNRVLKGGLTQPDAVELVRSDLGAFLEDRALGGAAREALGDVVHSADRDAMPLASAFEAARLLAGAGDEAASVQLLQWLPQLTHEQVLDALAACTRAVRRRQPDGTRCGDELMGAIAGCLGSPVAEGMAPDERAALLRFFGLAADLGDAARRAAVLRFLRGGSEREPRWASEEEFRAALELGEQAPVLLYDLWKFLRDPGFATAAPRAAELVQASAARSGGSR